MHVSVSHATDILDCLCRLHNVCVPQRESRILTKTTGAGRDGGFEDLPEETPLPPDPLDEEPAQIRRAADEKQGRRDVLAEALARAKKWRPRSSTYSYIPGTMAARARAQAMQNAPANREVVSRQLARDLAPAS